MLHVTAVLEDVRIVATVAIEPEGGHLWQVILSDALTGQFETRLWTDAEMGAVMALAIGGEQGADYEEPAYRLAEQAVGGLPRELRPIP